MHGAQRRRAVFGAALIFGVLTAWPAGGSATPEALRARAFDLAYNLDHEEAIATFRQALALDPNDPATHRGLAAIVWLNLAFRRGVVTVDEYLGNVAKPTVAMKPPPPDLAATFYTHANRALALADERIKANPKDAHAHYQAGTAVGLLASYAATIEGRVLGAFRQARRAYDEHEQVLALDAGRKDAGLIVGTYRYVVATLSLPIRWMAYVVGFGGGREKGLQMIEQAAAHAGDSQTDARFALVLIYNRERRYPDALRVIGDLQRLYPRNRLLWLEAGATALRAARFAEAEAMLEEGLAKLERDPRPRMFGEEGLWRYKRGAALVALRRRDAAERDLKAALASETREWVRGRVHTELGKLRDLAGDRARARADYETAIQIGEANNDRIGVAEAKRLLREGYR